MILSKRTLTRRCRRTRRSRAAERSVRVRMNRLNIAITLFCISNSACANVIFPAFAGPYVSVAFFPATGAVILLSEAIVYKILCRKLSILTVVLLVVAANAASSAVGIGVSAVLPSGLVKGTQGVIESGPNFSLYFKLGFVIAYLISILIEGAVLKLASRKSVIDRPYTVSLVANTVSYLLFVGIVWLVI